MSKPPVLYWMRRDFRLRDNAALTAACASGHPVIPVFLCDEGVSSLGAAPKWRLGLAVDRFAQTLKGQGSRLILRRGDALAALRALVAETGAVAVHWSRLYDPTSTARDTAVKAALRAEGVQAISHSGHVLCEPWTVRTGAGGFYKVYTPFWKALRGRDMAGLLPAPQVPPPEVWPESDALADWGLGRAMNRGAAVVAGHLTLGEDAALGRLDRFVATRIAAYDGARDMLAEDATSGLSEPLSYGEIAIARCWQAGNQALSDDDAGAERFLKELVWRDFAYHLLFHTPHITKANWRPEWDRFPWRDDNKDAQAWRRGRTGIPVIDAAMRELFVTGRMHNRARMLVASYLTKHLMTHWKIGQAWFSETLVDWDPASNAMGWQWAAGSGPDAAPFFRIFNPETQAAKFDPAGRYVQRWLAEVSENPGKDALSFFDAIPSRWSMAPGDPYPQSPIVGLAEGRTRALDAYRATRS